MLRTNDLGLTFGGAKGDDIQISAYVDAVCINSRRSVLGVAVIMLAGAAISYFPRTQEVAAFAR